MLRSMKELDGFTIGATDGDIGMVNDCYFDDLSYTVRYVVVDTGGWLTGRKVLLSPIAFRAMDWENQAPHGRADEGAGGEESRVSTRRSRSRGSTRPRTMATMATPRTGRGPISGAPIPIPISGPGRP